MSKPYSMDLRERVVRAVEEEGLSRRQAAARFTEWTAVLMIGLETASYVCFIGGAVNVARVLAP